MDELKSAGKPFQISKWEVWEAWQKVKEFTTVDLLTCEENSRSKEPAVWIRRGLERGAFGVDPAEYFL